MNSNKDYEETINDIKFKMIFVQGGDLYLGDDKSHKITVPDFHIAETPVTQALWRAVMGKEPQHLYFKGDQRPVERVSWEDIILGTSATGGKGFLKELNKLSNRGNYKLPSEAMWQFAAQGGNLSEGYDFAGSNHLDEVAWYDKNSNGETKSVQLKLANELGIYDMSGNVWEWSADIWDSQVTNIPKNGLPNKQGKSGIYVVRGGSWNVDASYCRASDRSWNDQKIHYNVIGFRLSRY